MMELDNESEAIAAIVAQRYSLDITFNDSIKS